MPCQIFHVDVNSAFLSWESVRRIQEGLPDLRDIPACIGGDPTKRTGIVVAKSIPAKKCGVQTGEPVAMALRKCPNMVIVPSDFDLYVRCSRAFKKICAAYTPVMESFSIDEVFLDMTGTSLLYPDPIAAAHEIKDRIYEVTVSPDSSSTSQTCIGTAKIVGRLAPCTKTTLPPLPRTGATLRRDQSAERCKACFSLSVSGTVDGLI